uniref:Uncharacterized protein n=1 Tax=Arundo donax TaxID=35708 RepID=A0A0A9B8E1_ARUDO
MLKSRPDYQQLVLTRLCELSSTLLVPSSAQGHGHIELRESKGRQKLSWIWL